MRTDLELLELAAKAVGVERVAWDAGHCERLMGYVGKQWLPLTDDGDALRLAVKLELFIDCMDDRVQVFPSNGGNPKTRDVIEFYGEDRYAATRRAIVLAAAEIGSK